jgi:excinuclease ABC subunit C
MTDDFSSIDAAETADTKSDVLKQKLATLPHSPGVYQFKNKDGTVIYVGKAKNLRSRVMSYFRALADHSAKTKILVSKIHDLDLIITSSEVEALILENNLIKQFKPKYNIDLRDDKTYPYIVVTNEPFPRIFPTRQVRRDGSKYFGPYTESKQMRILLEAIGEIFQVRSCSLKLTEENITAKKFKVCLDYHIKKCQGPCEALQTETDYDAMIAEIKRLLNGKTRDVMRSIEARMKDYAKNLKFEQASTLKRQLDALERYSSRQKVLSTDLIDRDIFAAVQDAGDACGVVFKVRDGKLLGSQHFYFANSDDAETADLIGRLMEKYYLETTDIMPDEIFAPVEPSNKEFLESLLQKRLRELNETKSVDIIIPQIGDKAKLVAMCRANAVHLLSEYRIQKQKRGELLSIPASVSSLQRDLRLKDLPRRIECFDNSHFQGSETVSSMVCFTDGKPRKSDYRKFKIRTVEGIDDFASMREVIERRYSGSLSEELPMPDLIVIDGGKGQLSAAYDVLQSLNIQTPVIGLAKRLEEVFFPNEQFSHNLPKTSSSLKLLQQVRDEAHRFAITFHRQLRDKRTLTTELTEIDGVGSGKAEKLLKIFGSVAQVESAAFDQLTAAVGKKTAEIIRRYFDQKRNQTSSS